jgi:hypothetical protein
MPLIGAEAVAASLVAFLASAVITAYLADWLGFAIAPFAILSLSLVAAAAVFLRLRRQTTADRPALTSFTLIVLGTFAWLMWRALPDFLPTGTGSDLTHHLALLAYIEQHWRLPNDPALGAYLGEMIDYTPGAHLLAVLAGVWFRSDALHMVHAVVALTVALKSGVVFLIARRFMPDGVPRIPFAVVATLLLWLPYVFFAGSFMEQSFLSQVVSELFAVAMWWALVVWDEQPSAGAMALFALFGTAAFLTWPIWVGPLVLTLVAIALVHRDVTWTGRLRDVAIATLPIAVVAAMHGIRHPNGFQMVGTGGFAIWPTPAELGWTFTTLSAASVLFSATQRRARTATLLLAATALQAMALVVTARHAGAAAPYLALKMFYLAIYPLTVAIALTAAAVWRAVPGVARGSRRAELMAWTLVGVIAIAVVRPLAQRPRVKPVVTQPVFLAGEWAHTRVPPACVDYLVADGYTAYWVHLAVFGNPRAAGRTLDEDTFEPKKAIVRWILPNSLPYAIADDFDALPRDIRTNVDVLARFGPAAVVKRRGPSSCQDDNRGGR